MIITFIQEGASERVGIGQGMRLCNKSPFQCYNSSSKTPAPKSPFAFPKSATSWGQNIQIHESVGTFLLQTATFFSYIVASLRLAWLHETLSHRRKISLILKFKDYAKRYYHLAVVGPSEGVSVSVVHFRVVASFAGEKQSVRYTGEFLVII